MIRSKVPVKMTTKRSRLSRLKPKALINRPVLRMKKKMGKSTSNLTKTARIMTPAAQTTSRIRLRFRMKKKYYMTIRIHRILAKKISRQVRMINTK